MNDYTWLLVLVALACPLGMGRMMILGARGLRRHSERHPEDDR